MVKPDIPLEPKEYFEDLEWVSKSMRELQKKYKDLWIAVWNKQVICAGADPRKVEDEAIKKLGKRDFPMIFVECGQHIY